MSPDASIGTYALLSDCRSAALVGRDGSVDWYCLPRFDSPSVFARILDPDGGHWSIRPAGPFEVERDRLEDTMVLRTEFRAEGGRVALTDALPLGRGERGHEIGLRSPHILLRRIEGLEGEVELELEFAPRPEYALVVPLVVETEAGTVVRGVPSEIHLGPARGLRVEDTRATARFALGAGEMADFALEHRRMSGYREEDPPRVDVAAELENTIEGWASWSREHRGYRGPYEEEVRRGALVLQALTYAPTGAIVGAPTTSLPSSEGGEENWDYRHAWLRDLSFTMHALWVAACPDEAEKLFYFLDRASGGRPDGDRPQVIMHGIEGERYLTERSLDHLRGFRGSRPVRVGNDAWRQRQLDVFGEVADSVHLLRERLGEEFDGATAGLVCAMADRAAEEWRQPDSGMWESRGENRHHLSSKVMCWLALDRATKLASRLGKDANVGRWKEARDEVRAAVLGEGWDESLGAYSGAFGSGELDASVLFLPMVSFPPADDPRMRSTIEAVERELGDSGLVRRWSGDAKGFLPCTYWLVECLALLGEKERAVRLFDRANACAKDLGLLSEKADPETAEPWGNFPQAFSHVGLINAARRLNETGAAG